MTSLFSGVRSTTIDTSRLRTHVLQSGPALDGPLTPVVLIHGNVSSALMWQPLMVRLDGPVVAIDLRGFGGSQTLPVDATRGVRDFSDDVAAALVELGIDTAHVVGWSMGAGVAMQLLLDNPQLVASLTLESPVSPYGFGGTSLAGDMLVGDAAGAGGGGANPDFVARLAAGDTTDAEQTSPRSVYRGSYVAPGFTDDHEDLWVESMLTTATGVDNYPGDLTESENWPGFAPGSRGVLNTMAPQHFDTSAIATSAHQPPILWIRGDADAIVNDASFFDLNMLGQAGIVPGWPGNDVAPPQPMVSQTRAVLAAYSGAGGQVTEHVMEGVGHSPHIERPEEFAALLSAHIAG